MLADEIRREARALGFAGVGIAPATPLELHRRAFRRYLEEGRHAGMAFLAQEPERREDPTRLLPGAKSVITLAWAYYQGDHGPTPEEPSGKIARYAWGPDYHQPLEARLNRLKDFILARRPDAAVRCAVDHAPLLERAYAQEAGLGFIGKHTLLITPEHGSWVLLAGLVTDLDLPYDTPGVPQCGQCTRCLDACPTGALTAPYELDSSRCIAYLTIEHKGNIPPDVGTLAGDWLFGCDLCQEACPYNQPSATSGAADPKRDSPEPTPSGSFAAQTIDSAAAVSPWLALDDAAAPRSLSQFARRFQGSALLRAGSKGLARNARMVLKNVQASART